MSKKFTYVALAKNTKGIELLDSVYKQLLKKEGRPLRFNDCEIKTDRRCEKLAKIALTMIHRSENITTHIMIYKITEELYKNRTWSIGTTSICDNLEYIIIPKKYIEKCKKLNLNEIHNVYHAIIEKCGNIFTNSDTDIIKPKNSNIRNNIYQNLPSFHNKPNNDEVSDDNLYNLYSGDE